MVHCAEFFCFSAFGLMEFRCFERSADSEAEERALSKVAVRTVCKDIAESSMVGLGKKNCFEIKSWF